MSDRSGQRWAFVAATAVPGGAYLMTLYPGPGGRLNFGDSAKFQYIGEVLGVPHEPGFPQYLVLDALWTRLPLPGSLAVRVNVLSAVCAVIAAALFFALARRLAGNSVAAVLATWAVFFGRTLWAASTEAEVYALNLAWVAGLMLIAYEWTHTGNDRFLAALLFGYGLSFGGHPSMIVLLPALAWLVFTTDRGKLAAPRWIGTALAAAGVGLSQYGYILWLTRQGSPYLELIPADASLSDLAAFMFSSRFGDRVFMGGWEGLLFGGIGRVLGEANVNFLLPALFFAGAGATILWRRQRHYAQTMLIAALCYAVFAAGYEIPDWEVYCLPLWLFVGWFVSVALGEALALPVAQRRPLVLAFCAALVVGVAFNFRLLDLDESDVVQPLLIAAAERDAVLVTHAEELDYHAIQTDNYYRLGLGLEESHNLRFVSAEGAFYYAMEYLTDTPMFAADALSLKFFTNAAVDLISESPSGSLGYGRTGTRDPVRTLDVVPRVGSPPALRRNGRGPIGRGGAALEAAVIGCRGRRVKVIRTFDYVDGDRGMVGLAAFLPAIFMGDWAVISARGPIPAGSRETLSAALRSLGSPQVDLGSVRSGLVVAMRVGAPPETAHLIVDPEQPATLMLSCEAPE